MAVLGHLICRTCKEQFCLGKWLRVDGVGFGFWRGTLEYEQLGLKVLNFLARHTNHQVQVLSDAQFDEQSLTEPLYDYRDVEDELPIDWPKLTKPQ
jgi:hypothetical protein